MYVPYKGTYVADESTYAATYKPFLSAQSIHMLLAIRVAEPPYKGTYVADDPY